MPSTIAEGWGRRYYKNEFIKFLIYALASCDETTVHLDFVLKSKYINEELHKECTQKYGVLGKKINKFMQMVMKNHLHPRKRTRGKLGMADDVPACLIDNHETP
jgi:hypothetical protein